MYARLFRFCTNLHFTRIELHQGETKSRLRPYFTCKDAIFADNLSMKNQISGLSIFNTLSTFSSNDSDQTAMQRTIFIFLKAFFIYFLK